MITNTRTLIFLLCVLLAQTGFSQNADKRTKVVVLGVGHTLQLANPNHQPAALRAYFAKENPDAFAIELFPEEYIRNDFYEYTYEQQEVIVPFAKENDIPVYPFDWKPADEDLILAFGTAEMEVPSFTRNPEGFQGFINFKDSTDWTSSLYFAEEESYKQKIKDWYYHYPETPAFDFARRLYLYRTFLQAKRIAQVAKKHPGGKILVVVGYFHKEDIEKILASNKSLEIVPSDSRGEITHEEIEAHSQGVDYLAVSYFNLIGTQSLFGFDRDWVSRAVSESGKVNPLEGEFYRIRFGLLTGSISSEEGLMQYRELLERISPETKFTWSGVKYPNRLDSYIDPFGNMTMRQRLLVEMGRENYNFGMNEEAEEIKGLIEEELKDFKLRMFQEYWAEYISKPS